MTSQEMRRATCRPGYWFVNVAAAHEDPDWREQVTPPPPDDMLFGYERSEFMAKQYRSTP